MLVVAGELNVLIKPNDIEITNVLNNLWDCEKRFIYKTKTSGAAIVKRPYLNILGASTTKSLREILPKDAHNSGFTARVILVFSDKRVTRAPALKVAGGTAVAAPRAPSIYKDLSHDLRLISQLEGEFLFTADGAARINEWHEHLSDTAVQDSRFDIYNDRRVLHALKLCMVFSADRGDDMLITEDDVNSALALLFETEADMPKAVKFVSDNTHIDTQEKALAFLRKSQRLAGGKPIPQRTLWQHIGTMVGPKDVWHIMTQLENEGRIKTTETGGKKYVQLMTERRNRLDEKGVSIQPDDGA
jgi:hypothetical protein